MEESLSPGKNGPCPPSNAGNMQVHELMSVTEDGAGCGMFFLGVGGLKNQVP